MRAATYLGLVLRRIWTRRLMLLGSFLGATLVIALLVVLPLYEASVSAVDLLFTFRQAPDSSVDLTAVATSTEYDGEFADTAAATVEKHAAPLRPWYPEIDERTVSREFFVIPLGFPDWLAQAEEWREAGADPETVPYPFPPPEATQLRLFTAPDLTERIEVLEGELLETQDPRDSREPILELVLGEGLARLTGTTVGDRFVVRPFASQPDWFEIVEVGGIARAVDPTAVIWEGFDPGRLAYLSRDAFDTWAVSFQLTDPTVDPWLRSERGFRRITASSTFTLHLDREAVTLENVQDLTGAVTGFIRNVAREEGIRTVTQLPGIIEDFDVRTVVFGAPILAMLALIVAGALYFLIYMASLTLEREAEELSLLRLRGATPFQTVGIHLMQSVILAGGAMLLAPAVARFMVSLTGRIPPMSTLTGGEALTVVQGRSLVPFVVAGGVMTFAAMGLAILPMARRNVLELRALASRPARQSFWQRYYIDVFLVVLAAVILWELRRQGIVDTDPEDLGLDPFSVAAPALFLFSGALLLLRVLPLVLRAIGWVMTRLRGMGSALPGWHLGRNPVPYGRLALLVWLTTGFGAFALTYAVTLETSYDDRASFAAGADLRIVGDEAGYLEAPSGTIGSPVYRSLGAPRLTSRPAELLAVRPDDFAEVVAWRPDFGADAPADLFGPGTLGEEADWGIELPSGTTALRMEALLVPPSWADREERGAPDPVRVMVRVADEVDRLRIFAFDGPFDDTGWQTLDLDLSGGRALNGPFDDDGGDLAIQALWLERDGQTGQALDPSELLIARIAAVGSYGEQDLGPVVTDEFTANEGFGVESGERGDYAANAYYAEVPPEVSRPSQAEIEASPLFREGPVTRWEVPGRNRSQPVPFLARDPDPLPFLLDREAASIAGLGIGAETVVGVDTEEIDAEIAGLVELVPTTGDPRYGGVVVTRLDGLLQWLDHAPPWSLSGTIARWAKPNELWVETDDPNTTTRLLLAEYGAEPDEVITARGVSADFSSRPIQVGLVSILLLGTGAGVVLALAGVTGYVLIAVRRRFREMGVLRALGFRRRGVAGTFAVEQLVVLGLGAVVGVLAGIGLMRLMIPFLQLGEDAADLIPPAIMVVSWPRLGLYLGVLTVLLVTSVLWSTRTVSARRLSEVLREVER
jgi:hypothetical protein